MHIYMARPGVNVIVNFLKKYLDYAITGVPFPPLHSILPTPSFPHSPPIVHIQGSYM